MKTKIAVLICGLLGGGLAAAPALEVITKSVPSSSGAGHSMAPSASAGGRYVVFVSHANNLVTNDDLRPFLDVFIRDVFASSTTLISSDASGRGGGSGDSSHASISTNGQFVLFSSDANNLVANDTNGAPDVFLRDLASGTTTIVSVGTNGTAAGRPGFGSLRPTMTPDARFVVFESAANDIVPGDTNNFRDLFIRDMQTGVTRLVTAGNEPPFLKPTSASVGTDGRRVAFVSPTASIVPDFGPIVSGFYEVYVRDMLSQTTHWASSNLTAYFNTEPNSYKCLNSLISSDGGKVAFKAVGPDGVKVHVLVHDIDAGTTAGIATNSHPDTCPAFSADGRWVAFEENNAIYLRDLINGTNLLITVNSAGTGPANGVSLRPVITPGAQYVVFVSSATDLVPGLAPPTNTSQIYARGVRDKFSYRVTNTKSDMHAVLPVLLSWGGVVFDTDAADIVTNDNNKSSDVFAEVLGAATHLVSGRHADRPARTGLQSAGLWMNSISSNGQRVAFSSLDDPRVSYDTNGQHDVFVRQLNNSSLFAISDPARRAIYNTNEAAIDAILSANGEAVLYLRELRYHDGAQRTDLLWRFVALGRAQVVDSNFTYTQGMAERFYAAMSPDGNTVVYPRYDHLMWKNIVTGSTGVVSDTGLRAPMGPSRSPAFSHDGRYVAFASAAGYLITNQVIGGRHMYVRDLASNTTRFLSVNTNGQPIVLPQVTSGVFSGNDRYVVYDGTFTGDQWPRIYRFDMDTGENLLVCTNCRNPAISFDGQTIAYNSTWGRLANSSINVIDLRTGQNEIITRDYAGNLYPAPQFDVPLLSADGRYVVFVSKVATLVANDTNRVSDVFVHDRVQGMTTLISRSHLGPRSAAGQSTRAVMAADGRTVAFQSFASDIVEGDYNERRDIFVVKLGVGDSDNDGMEDDWEVAQFGNLSRDGAGDEDSDGQTDLQEYLAGTNPTNGGSILRVITVTPLSGGNTTVVWSAVVGRNYIVQFKDSLDATWTNASGVTEADSTSMSFAHNSSSPQRFYRVIAVQ